MFHTQICANGTKFVINWRMSISAWKTHIVFLRTEIVNISPVTRDLRISTACSVTAPCTAWSTVPGIPGILRKTAGGSRTAQAAPFRTIRSIMIRSCRSYGRRRESVSQLLPIVTGRISGGTFESLGKSECVTIADRIGNILY